MAHTYPLDDAPSLLQQQGPVDAPTISALPTGTDLLLAPTRTVDRLRHFSEQVYRLDPESHLVRFLKVLMGDAGAGQVRKRFLAAHLQSVLQGSHFYDLDRFYGALFGLGRLSTERLSKDPYTEVATAEEWRQQQVKDGSYRARVEQFSKAVNHGATRVGMELAAEALLGVDCDIYESWVLVDQGQRTYGEVEAEQVTYGGLEGLTYGQLDSDFNLPRNEFIVRPRRAVTPEEARNVRRVGERLKPAQARMIVDPIGVATQVPVAIRGAYSDSEHWEIVAKVVPAPQVVDAYPPPPPGETAVEIPQPVFCGYQGQVCGYNFDISRILTYAQTRLGVWAEFTPVDIATPVLSAVRGALGEVSIQRRTGSDALRSVRSILAGRAVSDGIMASALYTAGRAGGRRL